MRDAFWATIAALIIAVPTALLGYALGTIISSQYLGR